MPRFLLLLTAAAALFATGANTVQAANTHSKEFLKKALVRFNTGDYTEALAILKEAGKTADSEILYWEGVCESNLQRFETAAAKLERVMSAPGGAKFSDAAFLAGQANFAIQEFKRALAAFRLSAARSYKRDISLYYAGYVENVLKNEDAALKDLRAVTKMSDSTMRPAAAFQMAEIYFEQGKRIKTAKKQRAFFLKKVKPAYQLVVDMEGETSSSRDALARIRDIDAKFPGTPATALTTGAPPAGGKTFNGTPLPLHKWVVVLTQDFKYDTNIIQQADQTLVKVSYAGSPYEKTTVLGRYQFLFDNRFVVAPEVEADATYYFRNSVANVFGSDNTNLNPAIRTRYDHFAWGKRAGALFDFEYLWGTRDYTSQHTQSYYQSSQNFVAGELMDLFPFGPATFKGHYKFGQNENYALGGRTLGLSLEQDVRTGHDQILLATVSYDYFRANYEFWDTGTYALSLNYVMPHLYWGLSAAVGFTLSVLDTMNQFSARGYEFTTNPNATLTKYFLKEDALSVYLNYAFTKNTSGEADVYAYTKNVFGVGASYNF